MAARTPNLSKSKLLSAQQCAKRAWLEANHPQLKEIDARPSDSIALALRTGAPIFVAKSVWSKGSIEAIEGKEPVDGEWRDATLDEIESLQQKPVIVRMKEPPKKEEK